MNVLKYEGGMSISMGDWKASILFSPSFKVTMEKGTHGAIFIPSFGTSQFVPSKEAAIAVFKFWAGDKTALDGLTKETKIIEQYQQGYWSDFGCPHSEATYTITQKEISHIEVVPLTTQSFNDPVVKELAQAVLDNIT